MLARDPQLEHAREVIDWRSLHLQTGRVVLQQSERIYLRVRGCRRLQCWLRRQLSPQRMCTKRRVAAGGGRPSHA